MNYQKIQFTPQSLLCFICTHTLLKKSPTSIDSMSLTHRMLTLQENKNRKDNRNHQIHPYNRDSRIPSKAHNSPTGKSFKSFLYYLDEPHHNYMTHLQNHIHKNLRKTYQLLQQSGFIYHDQNTSEIANLLNQITPPRVVNLTTTTIPKETLNFLELGPTFCPHPRKEFFQDSLESAFQQIKTKLDNHYIKGSFGSTTPHELQYLITKLKTPFPSSLEIFEEHSRRPRNLPLNIQKFLNNLHAQITSIPHGTHIESPICHQQWKSIDIIHELQRKHQLIIKPADKGGAITILSQAQYIERVQKHLQDTKTYHKLAAENPQYRFTHDLDTFYTKLKTHNIIDGKTFELLKDYPTTTPPQFYILPKIHKPNAPGRPIISACTAPTNPLSAYIDHHLNPLRKLIPSHLENTPHLLDKLKAIKIPENCQLVTMDVSALYTCIPHNDGIDAVKTFLNNHPLSYHGPPIPTLLAMIKRVLTTNYFQFNDDYYLQLQGTAMGTRMAPAYADIFMHVFEEKFLKTQTLLPLIYHRFLDDIFMIWPHGTSSLKSFHNDINSMSPSIKLTMESSETDIAFLDLKIYIENNTLSTDLYRKPTDTNNTLHFKSFHPNSTKIGIVKSQTARYLKNISDPKILYLRLYLLYLSFVEREYPSLPLLRAIKSTLCKQRNDQTSSKLSKQILPIILPYHPDFERLLKPIITGTLIPFLTNQIQFHRLQPTLCYKRHSNLKNHLIHTREQLHCLHFIHQIENNETNLDNPSPSSPNHYY